MQLTNEEIQFIKNLYQENLNAEIQSVVDKKVQTALNEIAEKYKPLLEKAAEEDDIELRKQLIEQQTEEAKMKETEIRNATI